MVDLSTYILKYLNTGKITTEELYTNDYTEELYESEHVRTVTKLLHIILYAKFEKASLHKVMENQFQHLTMTQRNELLKLLHKFEDFQLNTWHLENRSSRLRVKIGREANLIATISITKGTQGNVFKKRI